MIFCWLYLKRITTIAILLVVFKEDYTTSEFYRHSKNSQGFTTMTNVSLVPFVCVRHPSGREALLFHDLQSGSATKGASAKNEAECKHTILY